ncbi:hypothetical protein [Pelosinus baikalensis]|uniref:Phage protein n=1 Tax=Pelosinus baikalensis TaxID=2892015 RepID=A0ABS8HQT9_9FIRM|nr:hypothetical protein [Pelosinus baikalensis]MCC5465541.1 hypothetical protein [Pelosinus baikalensis]
MKKVPFDLFEEGQTIYFDIPRIEDLEKGMGMPITTIVSKQEVGVGFCLTALQIGLRHHYRKGNKEFYAAKMGEYFENDGTLGDVITPIIRAIMGSGIFGKEAIEKIEKNVAENSESESDMEENSKNV